MAPHLTRSIRCSSFVRARSSSHARNVKLLAPKTFGKTSGDPRPCTLHFARGNATPLARSPRWGQHYHARTLSCQRLSGFDVDWVVERDQCLQRSVGPVSTNGADFTVHRVKRHH